LKWIEVVQEIQKIDDERVVLRIHGLEEVHVILYVMKMMSQHLLQQHIVGSVLTILVMHEAVMIKV
jgi:hypothetical protein